jgi:hypothetical protein
MSNARSLWSAAALLLCTMLSRAHAQAQSPGDCSSERFIVLTGEGLDPALFNEVRTDLAAELAHRGIDVCAADATPREPAAIARLSATDATVVVELDDRVTHKRVGRDLTLERLPANGRALAIAIAIDELLRASWAELTLRREEPRVEDDEAEARIQFRTTRRTINARGKPLTPTQLTLSGEVGYLHSPEHFNAFSLGARFTVRPWKRGWFALGLAGLSTLPVKDQLGDVLASGLRGTLTAGLCARDRQRTFACVGARAELAYLSLRGFDAEQARGRSKHAGAVLLSAVGLLGFPLAERRTLFTELGIGGVALGAEATDGTRVIMGLKGLMLAVNLGLEFEL